MVQNQALLEQVNPDGVAFHRHAASWPRRRMEICFRKWRGLRELGEPARFRISEQIEQLRPFGNSDLVAAIRQHLDDDYHTKIVGRCESASHALHFVRLKLTIGANRRLSEVGVPSHFWTALN